MGYIGKKGILPSPKQMLATIDLQSSFIGANHLTILDALLYHFIYWSGFLRKPTEQTMNPTFTNRNPKSIVQGFFQPGKRQILAGVKVGNKCFNIFSITHRGIYPLWKIRNILASTITNFVKALVLSIYSFNGRNIYYLPGFSFDCRLSLQGSSTTCLLYTSDAADEEDSVDL